MTSAIPPIDVNIDGFSWAEAGINAGGSTQGVMMKRLGRLVIVCAMGSALASCAWVKLTPEAEQIRVVSAEEVADCEKMGRTTSMVRDRVAGFSRKETKVREELETLARNTASDLDGDTVVPIGKPRDGRQAFDVYRCVNP